MGKEDNNSENNKKVSRRTILKGAIGTGLLISAGQALPGLAGEALAAAPKKWDSTADVIVVGSGATGFAAAVAAVEKGASVVILEKSKELGGCSIISSGLIDIQGGTRIQKINNMDDSPEKMFGRISDYKNLSTKRGDAELLRAFCNANPGTIDWLEKHGVKFMDSITTTGPAGPTAKITQVYHRIWWDKEGPGLAAFKSADGITSGAGLIKPLETFARQKGVKILMEHKMTGIIREGGTTGKVLGVQVTAGKKKMNFRAKKAVILGSGGWKGQKFLRKLYDGRMTEDLEDSGAPFINSDGSALVAALKAGAVLMSDRAMDGALYRRKYGTKHYNFPLNSPWGATGLSIAATRTADVIYINKFGRRYVNEQDIATLGGFNMYDASLAQPDHILWTIFDDAAARKYKWEVKPPTTEPGCAFSAPTVEELAGLIKVPAGALAETVQKYNSYVDAGSDPDFGKPKNFLASKIATAPFHAAWISLFVHDTCGGLAVNPRAQVLDSEGKVIQGLYAGGEATGGIEVAGLPRCVILGRIAGENAAS